MIQQDNKVTNAQLQKIHVLLRNNGLIDDKKELVAQLTNGRTESTRFLTKAEATFFIQRLCDIDPLEKQKKSVIHLAYVAGIIYGDTPEDYQINKAKLDMFLKERGTVKKELAKMTYAELMKVHRQFEAMTKNIQKTSDNKAAKAATDKLLSELNLTVSAN